MTIVFMRKAEANDLRDCIDTCTESHFFFERSALIWILFLWIIWNVTAVLLFLIGSYQNDAIICIFENWFWRGYLINILLPQLICILVAAAFVLSEHRIAAGVMLIFYPFFGQLISRTDRVAKDECACVYLCLECISKVISYFLSKC